MRLKKVFKSDKMQIKIFLVLIYTFFLTVSPSNSQEYNSGINVKTEGFIINLGGQFFFQPCENLKMSFWESLDGRSFSLGEFKEDMLLESLANIGDSLSIYCQQAGEKKKMLFNLRYFYAEIEINLMILDTSRFELFHTAEYELYYDNKTYPLEGFRMDNRIKKIIPVNTRDKKIILKFYHDNGFAVPSWLSKTKRRVPCIF